MTKKDSVFVAGGRGLVGSSVLRKLSDLEYANVYAPGRNNVDLLSQDAVNNFFEAYTPKYVVLAAAKVGGIIANSTAPADFIYQNLVIQTNVIHAAYKFGTKKIIVLGSSCIYPRMCPQPIKEEYLLTGALEPTNEAYAVAKIAGLKMAEYYRKQYGFNAISLMPTNLYGINDNFDLKNSHVLPALIRKFHEAKVSGAAEVTAWGTGSPLREFLHVDDLADAIVHLLHNYDGEQLLNVGTGEDITIKELTELVASVVGFTGSTLWDTTKPDGTPRKLLDVSRIHATGWKHKIGLQEGIASTYEWYKENVA